MKIKNAEIKNFFECDILVAGGGIGGLVAAKKSADMGKEVILVSNGKIFGGASYFPLKGTLGIQATALEKEDKELFFEDIRGIGKGMDNPHMINAYIENIRESVGYLNEIGFEPWLRKDRRPACFAKYARDIYLINEWDKAREKGEKIFESLKNIQIIENSRIIYILKENEKTAGAVFQNNEGEFFIVKSSVVIMATGGVGGLYEHNLYPKDVDGSGHIVMLDAGAEVQNMEFIQFIPAFIKPVYNTLFGEHTLKYCTGMYDLDGNLLYEGDKNRDMWLERSAYAPFSCDFKCFEIDLKMMECQKGVKLKFSEELYKDKGEFYVVYLNWLKEKIGIDMCKDEVIISPFAHSCNGGVKTSDWGETKVQGLFAAGELLSGVEGANRLGGNSVGGALVFGKRAAEKACEYIEHLSEKKISDDILKEKFENWLNGYFDENTEDKLSKSEILQRVKKVVTENGGIKRNKKLLEEGLSEIENLQKSYNILNHLKENSLEVYFKTEAAKMLLTAMINRKESRGAHYREDFPKKSEELYRIVISKENNNIKIKKDVLI